jgi:arsenate reductase (glutaredoxin)
MKKVYYLKSCSTCQRILKEVAAEEKGFELQNIKEEPITEQQLLEMKNLAGSYESLFSKKSMKYRAWGLHEKSLSEKDMQELILKEYTFLKRPVFVVNDRIFIGNSKAVVDNLKVYINQK